MTTDTPTLLTCYACTRCQREHRRCIDPEYGAHLPCQSKHGVYQRLPLDHSERFTALLEAEGYSTATDRW